METLAAPLAGSFRINLFHREGILGETKFVEKVPNETSLSVSRQCRFKLVRSTARYAIHLQFDISANGLEISVVQRPKCHV
jgi:hypothetical protein